MKNHRNNRTSWGAVLGFTGIFFAGPAFGQSGYNAANTDQADLDFLAEAESLEPVGLFDVADGDLEGQAVEMDSFGKVDLAVKDLEIAKVLQLLSIQSQKNIVLSRNVAGTVSADLYGVTFHEALDSILDPNGFGYEEKGNFVFVYTQAELEERELANRKTVTKVMHLNYLSAPDAATIAESLISENGKVTFSAEIESGILPSTGSAGENSYALGDTLVVRDYEENVAEIEALITQLDLRPKQVEIEATILQASLTEANAFGVDFSVFNDLSAFDFANPLNAIDALGLGGGPQGESGGGVQSTVGNTQAGNAGVKVGYVGSDAAVFLRALDAVTDTTVVAKPKLLVLNRQRADLLVGEKLGYLSTTVTETSETQTVEFLDVGTQLSVRPFISREGTIRLELKPSISDGSVSSIGGLVIPNEITQEMITNVIVEDGQTVVIGGLFREATTVDRSQVPGLGDVPILGAAFRGQDDSIDRTEVIFLIKTTVMEPSQMALQGQAGEQTVYNARVGAREGLLPWSTDKMVSSHLIKAKQAAARGDEESLKKALWHIDLALHLSPTSADALALKQKITGEQIAYSNRDQLRGMMDLAIDDSLNAAEAAAVARRSASTPDASTPEPAAPDFVETALESAEADVVETETVAETDTTVEPAAVEVTEQTVESIEEAPAAVAEVETDLSADAGEATEGLETFEGFETVETAETTEAADDLDWAFDAEGEFDADTTADIETAEVVEVPGGEAQADADTEWSFDFPEDVTEVATDDAPAQTDGFDTELFFDTPAADAPATETATSAPVEPQEPASSDEAEGDDPVFDYYEQLMSEVNTED